MLSNLIKWLFYNFRYLNRPRWDTGESPPELKAYINSHSPGKALDLGAGTGTNMLALLDAGWDVIGVEYALFAAFQAKKKIRKQGFQPKLLVRSVTNLHDLSPGFDLVLDIGCFHGLSGGEKEKYVLNLKQFLGPGGAFLLYGFKKTTGNFGISEAEIENFSTFLSLISIDYGSDKAGRESIWLYLVR